MTFSLASLVDGPLLLTSYTAGIIKFFEPSYIVSQRVFKSKNKAFIQLGSNLEIYSASDPLAIAMDLILSFYFLKRAYYAIK